MLRKYVQLLLFLESFARSLTETIYVDSSRELPGGNGSIDAPLNTLEEAFKIILESRDASGGIVLASNALPYTISSTWSFSKPLSVKFQGSALPDFAEVFFEGKGKIILSGFSFHLEKLSFKQLNGSLNQKEMFLLNSKSTLVLEMCHINSVMSSISAIFIHALSAAEISFINLEISGVAGSGFTHFILAEVVQIVIFSSVKFTNNTFVNQVLLEVRQSSLVELTDCLFSNNIVKGISSAKPGPLFNLFSGVKILRTIIEKNFLVASTVFNITGPNSIAGFLEILFCNFTQNTGTASTVLLISATSNNNMKIALSSVTLQYNYALGSLIEFKDTLSSASLDSVRLINNFAAQALTFSLISNISINDFLCSESNIYKGKFINLEVLNKYPGPCLLIYDYRVLKIAKANVHSNFAISSITGFALLHTSKISSTQALTAKLDEFFCEENTVMNNNTFLTFSGNCLYINIQGFIYMSNSRILNNQMQYMQDSNHVYGGNPCVSSDGLTASMKVKNSIFSGNKAFSECMCFKFDGYLIDIQDSNFFFNTGVGTKDNSGAEGGSLYLGADNIILSNLTLSNSSSPKGAGIFLHNKFQKKFQSLVAYNVSILFNKGIQTSGIDFDATLLVGLFNFTDCTVSNNMVEFYGVISTFFFTEITLHFIRCHFERNMGYSAGGAISFYHFAGLIFISDCVFLKNTLTKNVFAGGSAIILYGTTYLCLVYVKNTVFEENYSDLKGGAVTSVFGTLHCLNCLFLNNYARYGGAVNLAVYCPGSYTNSRFISKTISIYGGAIFTADEAALTIVNTTFEGLSAIYGGAIKMDGLLLTLTLENVTFIGNLADRGAAVDFFNALDTEINLKNVIFIENVCLDSLLNLVNLALNITDIFFLNNTGRIFQTKTVVVNINNLSIDSHKCPRSNIIACGGYLQEGTDFSISHSRIFNVISEYIQDFISLSDSSIYMQNCSLKAIKSSSKSLFLFGKTSLAELSNIYIQGVDGEIINLEESALHIFNLHVFNSKNSKSKYGTIYCYFCTTLTINYSVFSDIEGAKYGGVLFISGATGEVKISNSIFNNCSSSGLGGSLYIKQSNIYITSSNFTDNHAENNGGAAYFECERSSYCEWSLQKNLFRNNFAKIKGGAYHSTGTVPLGLSTNKFENNSAVYGPDYSSFPVRLTLELEAASENETAGPNLIPIDCETLSSYCIIFDVASGQILPWVSFAIIDTYGQKMVLEEGLAFLDYAGADDFYLKGSLYQLGENVSLSMPIKNTSLETTFISLSCTKKLPENITYKGSKNVIIKGVNTIQSKRGSFNFSEIQIQAEPNTLIKIKIKSDLIPEFLPIYISESNSLDQAEQSTREYAFILPAVLRNCIQGEIYRQVQNVKICFICPKNQYSLDVQDRECQICPKYAHCEGGAKIIIEKGFWRSNTNSTRIYACNPISDSCLGGFKSECVVGYTGNLCGICIFSEKEKWFKKGLYFCEPCGNLYLYIIILVVGVLFMFVFIVYLIFTRKRQDHENYLLMRMLTTHIQTVSLVSNIKIALPTALSSMNSVQAPVTSIESFVFAFECFKDSLFSNVYAIKLMSSVIILFMIILMVNLAYVLIGCLKKQEKKQIYQNLFNALIIIFTFLQPSFINFYIQNLSCDEIDGKNYLTLSLDEECWNGTHYAISAVITIPMLLFWMIVFPGLLFSYMLKNRSRLHDDFVFQITRSFLIGYKRKFYFWEFLTMLRKFLIILLTTFLRNNQQVVIYILIPVLASFFFLQNYASPFEHARHNRLEIISLNAAFLTYFSAIYYIRSITEQAKYFSLTIILASNTVYFCYWGKLYLTALRKKLKGRCKSCKFIYNIAKILGL